MKTKTFLLVILMLAASGFVSAQTLQQIEDELVRGAQEIENWSAYGSNYDLDKLAAANKTFSKTLSKYAKRKDVLGFSFSKLKEFVSISTSADGKFRVYSWDTNLGGTMHDYDDLYQFVGNDGKIYVEGGESEEEDMGAFTYDVFDLPLKNGTIYMVCTTFIASTQDHFQSLKLLKITGGKTEAAKLIKTAKGLTDNVGFEYNFFSVVDREERPIKLFTYDSRARSFKFPVVIESEKFPLGEVTDRFITYRFDGKNFVKASR
ncbi:MAG: hypothetical protein R2681_10495 [Pyrinomonadaceae bacterium]